MWCMDTEVLLWCRRRGCGEVGGGGSLPQVTLYVQRCCGVGCKTKEGLSGVVSWSQVVGSAEVIVLCGEAGGTKVVCRNSGAKSGVKGMFHDA